MTRAQRRRVLLAGCVGPYCGASIVAEQQVDLVDALRARARAAVSAPGLLDLSVRDERTRLLRTIGLPR